MRKNTNKSLKSKKSKLPDQKKTKEADDDQDFDATIGEIIGDVKEDFASEFAMTEKPNM